MDSQTGNERVVVVGAGPAGLTAALELGKLGLGAVVFESDKTVGGQSRTVTFRGCRIDLGGHRFFTKVPEIEAIWHEILGDDLLVRKRISRIYYRDRFFDYPLKPVNALTGLGLNDAVRVMASYLHARLFPRADESTFDVWVRNRFGQHLFEIFFKTYTEKVWGMPCSEISADWAAQRIKDLDLIAVLKNSILRNSNSNGGVSTSLIDRFFYPRHGPGMMWERCRDLVESHGIKTDLGSRVVCISHDGKRVSSVDVEGLQGWRRNESCSSLISSMPLAGLIETMNPAPPREVLDAAKNLRHRDFLIVGLIVERADLFPDNWIYIHSPEVRVGRIQNFKNWSPEMVADHQLSCIGLEYFVNRGEDLWNLADDELVEFGASEADALGLFEPNVVQAGTVLRVPGAYPVYDSDYEKHMQVLRRWLGGFDNLFTIGRGGQHRYNNQDHSMLTGMLAARNVAGEKHDLWSVNADQSFHEEVHAEEREAR